MPDSEMNEFHSHCWDFVKDFWEKGLETINSRLDLNESILSLTLPHMGDFEQLHTWGEGGTLCKKLEP